MRKKVKNSPRTIGRHSTSPEYLNAIIRSGYFRPRSYFTFDPIENLTPSNRVNFLVLDGTEKGNCCCKCEIRIGEFVIPPEGLLTDGGATQILTKKKIPINRCYCKCYVNPLPFILGFSLLGGVIGYACGKGKIWAILGGLIGCELGIMSAKISENKVTSQ